MKKFIRCYLITDNRSKKNNWGTCSNYGKIIQINKPVWFNPKYTLYKKLLEAVEESTLTACERNPGTKNNTILY